MRGEEGTQRRRGGDRKGKEKERRGERGDGDREGGEEGRGKESITILHTHSVCSV